MRFRLKVKVLGWRLEIQSAAAPSPALSSSPPHPSPPQLPSPSPRPSCDSNRSMEEPEPASLVPSPCEKAAQKTPRDYLALAAVAIRVWQLVSSSFVYISMVSLFLYIRHTRKWNAPLGHVQELGLASTVYSTIVLSSVFAFRRWKKLAGWPVFAWSTFGGDLMMMGLAIANITMLGQAGVPHHCRGLMPPDQYGHQSVGLLTQSPSMTIGVTGTVHTYGDFCDLPRVVYGFTVASIFSHTLSILLTVFQLQRLHKSLAMPESQAYPGHVEIVIPPHIANRGLAPRPFTRAAPPARPHPPSILRGLALSTPLQPGAPVPTSNSSSHSSRASTCSPGSTYTSPSTSSSRTEYSTAASRYTPSHCPSSQYSPASSSACPPARRPERLPAQDDPNKYANMPPMEIIPFNPRVSQDSVSTNPELYLVTDGFRPEDPPEYTSRPSSLYNGRNCP